MDREIQLFLISFFVSKSPELASKNWSDMESIAYLDKGILDSMQLVEMISVIESKFNIRFEMETMQLPEFRTIGGLAGIIGKAASVK